ncbi:hypothetical protein HmCmsJML010_03137 [Escherichia coli]|uniref:hypothetical protein n=1 Tax=Enterobacteriaceae TaxID=543 RepID=UPI0010C4FC05|nr:MULTISPECIES: hypothetical protein [Enterobacteriaceae]HEM7941895.1 hypothetical protein [Citrobacter freundii]EHM0711555.1 hypothetical protein [Escherichia coli]EIG1887391.1 hypothetical protein [Escherichia coli]EJD2612411.1 hypothetical protein [Escherichia coli]EJS6325221.1 hypothetical protein [Escherichia coli]
MELSEKILFAYPTLLREGMSAQKPYPPEPLLIDMSAKKINTIIVTASIYLLVVKNTFINVDIYLDGKIVTQDTESLDGYQEVMDTTYVSDDILVVTSAMHVKDVVFPKSGQYEIRTRLMEIDCNGETKEIDTLSCYIAVTVNKEE